jgi:hypothetical protein
MSCKGSIESIVVDRPEPTAQQPQGMCLDKGYDYQEVRDILAEFGFIAHIRAQRRRGPSAQTRSGLPGATLGGGTGAKLAEPFSSHLRALGEEA